MFPVASWKMAFCCNTLVNSVFLIIGRTLISQIYARTLLPRFLKDIEISRFFWEKWHSVSLGTDSPSKPQPSNFFCPLMH